VTLRVHPDEIVEKSSSPLLVAHPTWERVRLSEIADVLNGFAFKSAQFDRGDDGVPLMRIRDVGRDAIDTNYLGDYDPIYLVEPGSLVIGMDGDFRIARWRGPTALLNQRVCKVTVRDADLYDPGLLLHVLPGYLDAVHAHTSSVTVKHLSSRTVQELPLPLPPLNEQRRIVAAIEGHLSRLDAADASLAAALRRLDALLVQASVTAFRGDWPRQPFAEVASVASNLVDPSDYPDLPHIAPNHIERATGRLLPYKTVAEDGVKSQKHLFRPGQIIYSKIRPYLAKATLVDFEGLSSADTYPIDTELDPSFLLRWLLTPEFTELAVGQQGRSVLPKINREQLSRLPVPVPPLEEQRRIVQEVEERLSRIDAMRASIERAQRRSKALRAAILERAFRGELVPQDPSDEPAETLLARIRAERDTSNAATGRRRRSVRP
jgi:type I restriction enzyme S subunit